MQLIKITDQNHVCDECLVTTTVYLLDLNGAPRDMQLCNDCLRELFNILSTQQRGK